MRSNNDMMRRYLKYILFCVVMGPLYAWAQQNDDNAFAGNGSVFLYQVFEPASPGFPDSKGNKGFILQRREKDAAAQWVTVKNFHSPQNAGELLDNYKNAKNTFPLSGNRFDAGSAWAKWKKYKTYDSLTTELSYQSGQMAFGILIADSTVKAGKTYQYRVLKNNEPTPAGNQMTSNWVAYPAVLTMQRPKYLHRRTERDAIILDWFVVDHTAQNLFNVYRAAGNEKEFHLIKANMISALRNDSLIYSIQDTKVAFDEMYRYYIAPINTFGGGGNIHSDTISATCMNPQQLLTAQYIRTRGDLKLRAILLHYVLPNPGYIGTVHIMRSADFDKDFEEIGVNGAHDTLYIDHRVIPGKKYYYYLQMTDKMGRNSARSIKTFGLFQEGENLFPARFVEAVPVKGGVKITWQNPPDHEVLSGYYVCRSTGYSDDFHRITTLLPVIDSINTYIDTSKNLQAGYPYSYTVLSENLSNVVSKNSMIAHVTPVETITPVKWLTPRNFKAIAENKFVRLLWYDMRLVNKNQSFYNLYRRSDIDTNYVLIRKNYLSSFTSYRDSTTQPGVSYTYALECADGYSGKSAKAYSDQIAITAQPLIAPAVSVFTTKDGAMLSWEPVTDKRIKSYFIYRYARGEKPAIIGEAKVSDRQFEDRKLTAGNTYYYYIQPDAENKPVKTVASNNVYLVY